MTLSLAAAKEIVNAAVVNGLVHVDNSPLSSDPERIAETFRDVDKQVAKGNGLYGCWLLERRYRISRFNNEIAEASMAFADNDLQGFLHLVEGVTDSRLVYELTFFPLLGDDTQRCFTWIEHARSELLIAVAIVAALRHGFFGVREVTPELRSMVEGIVQALRHKEPVERSGWWWQIAALGRFAGPMNTWMDSARYLWATAASEIETEHVLYNSYVQQTESLRNHCAALMALLAAIGERGNQQSRHAASHAVLADFDTRLESDKWSLPQLKDQIETAAYLPACGWAIAQNISAIGESSWLRAILNNYLPNHPQWTVKRDYEDKCALILLAATQAIELLFKVDSDAARNMLSEISDIARRWLPDWLWNYPAADSAIRFLPLALISIEFADANSTPDQVRVLHLAREVRHLSGLEYIVGIAAQSGKADSAILTELKALRDERAEYETSLNGEEPRG